MMARKRPLQTAAVVAYFLIGSSLAFSTLPHRQGVTQRFLLPSKKADIDKPLFLEESSKATREHSNFLTTTTSLPGGPWLARMLKEPWIEVCGSMLVLLSSLLAAVGTLPLNAVWQVICEDVQTIIVSVFAMEFTA